MSGLNLTCTGSGLQLAAAHKKWVENLCLLLSEQGLFWRMLPQITPDWQPGREVNECRCLVTFHFRCCEQVTNPQRSIWILSSETCIRVKILFLLSCLPPGPHANYTGVMETTLETCTCGASDRGLPFAQQLTETLQDPRAGTHPWPSTLGPVCQGTSTWRSKIPLSKYRRSLQTDARKGSIEDEGYGLTGRLWLAGRGQEERTWSARDGAAHPAQAEAEGLVEQQGTCLPASTRVDC